MNSPIAERLQDAVSQARWNEAVALLQTSDPVEAAAALGNLPFEQQQSLFRRLPQDPAAAIVAQFPYYLRSYPIRPSSAWAGFFGLPFMIHDRS